MALQSHAQAPITRALKARSESPWSAPERARCARAVTTCRGTYGSWIVVRAVFTASRSSHPNALQQDAAALRILNGHGCCDGRLGGVKPGSLRCPGHCGCARYCGGGAIPSRRYRVDRVYSPLCSVSYRSSPAHSKARRPLHGSDCSTSWIRH